MNLKTFIILSIVFALIIGSTLQIVIVNAENVEEENESIKEKELAEKLISMYENIKEKALEILENKSLPEEVIEEINNAIAEGDALIEQAKEKINSGNYTQAIELAKEAINSLGNIVRKHLRFRERIRERFEEQAAKGLLMAIKRHRDMIVRLEELLVKLKDKGFSIENATKILEKAKVLLDEAESLAKEGNITGAAHKMAESRNLIGKAMSTVKKCAYEKLMHRIRNETLEMIKRIKEEIERAEKQINKLKGKIPPRIANKTKIDERLQGVINHLEQLKQKLSDLLERKFENGIEGMQKVKESWGKFKDIQKELNETETEIGED
jgi:DNA repair exonuclease SbcCD ATPase subunit